MINRLSWGILSSLIGLLGLVFTLTATHAESFRTLGSARLFNFLDSIGFIAAPSPNAEAEVKAPSIFSLTDETALIGLLYYGIYLAGVAVILAIWAEAKREDTLHIGVGFTLGCGAIVSFNFGFGMLTTCLGAIALFVIRKLKARPQKEVP